MRVASSIDIQQERGVHPLHMEMPEDYLSTKPEDALEDPVRNYFRAKATSPDLDEILGMFPRTTGDAPFDSAVIAGNIERLRTDPEIKTGHPFLDLSVKTGLAYIDATFQGDHPKYGVKAYGQSKHDGFPPIIIAAVDALSAWGMNERARQLFRYWLLNFVNNDGTVRYYGTSISEYGELLHTAALLRERAGAEGWWNDCFGAIDRLAGHLLRLHSEAQENDGLIAGSPEADERQKVAKYFHNNAWASKGLSRWADTCRIYNGSPAIPVSQMQDAAKKLAEDTIAAIERTWPSDPESWWLSPRVEPLEEPQYLTQTRDASYTNYRYWLELLSSGLLPEDMANRLIEARLRAGGQFCGMTRFSSHLDDWPLTSYLYALWSLGRRDDFLLSLYGHVAYHQAEGHLAAYEQVSFPPGQEKAPYCLPCQLVAARAARLLVE